jgi:hypothetical protein
LNGRTAYTLALIAAWVSGAACAAPAEQAYDTAPLRVVRSSHAQPEALKQWIVASMNHCAAELHLPAPPWPPGLNDEVLGRFVARQQEELFHGGEWALYETERSIAADVRNGCRLTVFTRRSAEAEHQCLTREGFANPPLGALMDAAHPAEERVDPIGPGPHRGCGLSKREIDVASLPKDRSGKAACVWRTDVIGQRMAGLAEKLGKGGGGGTRAAHQPGSFDSCLYAALPEYRSPGGRRAVVVKTETPALVGQTGVTLHAPEQPGYELERLSDDQPIAPDRFSSAALKAFASQPSRSPLGD